MGARGARRGRRRLHTQTPAVIKHTHINKHISATPDTAGEEGKVEDLFVFNDTIYNFIGTCNKQSPYAYSSSTHRFPDERTPIEATPLSATSAELGLGLGVVWFWDGIHFHASLRTRSPSSRHLPFTHYPFPPRSLVCGGQPSPHKPRLVVSIAHVLHYPPPPTRTVLY